MPSTPWRGPPLSPCAMPHSSLPSKMQHVCQLSQSDNPCFYHPSPMEKIQTTKRGCNCLVISGNTSLSEMNHALTHDPHYTVSAGAGHRALGTWRVTRAEHSTLRSTHTLHGPDQFQSSLYIFTTVQGFKDTLSPICTAWSQHTRL